jgi:hypothetical protein
MASDTRTEKALTLARRIETAKQDLELARDEVEKAQRKLDALVAEFEAVLGAESRGEDEADEQQMSRAGQIVALLNGSPTQVWSIAEIAGALKVDNIASLRATLNRLAGARRIGRSARGEYQATEDPDYLPQPPR